MKLIRLESFTKLSDEEIIKRIKESSLMDDDLMKYVYYIPTIDEQSIYLCRFLGICVVPINPKRKIDKKAKTSNLRFGIFWNRDDNTFDLSVYRIKMSGHIPLITVYLRGKETHLIRYTWSPSED